MVWTGLTDLYWSRRVQEGQASFRRVLNGLGGSKKALEGSGGVWEAPVESGRVPKAPGGSRIHKGLGGSRGYGRV